LKTDSSVYFYLWEEKPDTNIIYMNVYNKDVSELNWIINSNRKLYLEGKFYPLIFWFDEAFASPDNIDLFLEKMKSSHTHKSLSVIRHNAYMVKFTNSGKIIYEGY
jgi:hypothetical protein